MEIRLNNPILFQFTAILGTCLVLGLASTLILPIWVLAGLIVFFLGIIVIKRPEIGLLCYILITSTVIDQNNLPRLSIGIGRLLFTDIILFALFGLILIRLLIERGFTVSHTPLDLPLLLFIGISLLSTILAIFHASLTFNDALGQVRIVMSYLTFFIVTNLIREKKQIQLLLNGLIILAAVVALATIAQYALGSSVKILPGRVETLGTEGFRFSSVTRVIPPGQSSLIVAFIAIFATLILRPTRPVDLFKYGLCGILGLAILVTFFRASWIMIGLSILLLGILTGQRERLRLFLWMFVAIVTLVVVLMVLLAYPKSRAANLVNASFARLSSLTNTSTYEDPNSSLRWRDFEYSYALPQISKHPVLGLGLGSSYRPLTFRDNADYDGRKFIHNGHLYVMVMTGLFAYFGLLWFLTAVLIRGFRFWRGVPDAYMRGIVLAFTLTTLLILIVSNVEPYLMTASWTPLIGIIAGINEVLLNKSADNAPTRLD